MVCVRTGFLHYVMLLEKHDVTGSRTRETRLLRRAGVLSYVQVQQQKFRRATRKKILWKMTTATVALLFSKPIVLRICKVVILNFIGSVLPPTLVSLG